ncbi:putative cathepsin B9 cysteine protease [Monocercomonoides exilis]|uniref:putative cathepsin B9 cysteine protease n=1 Tax=Monocercomonoides exilis TaxID=2049356 RepID=UPI003559E6B2|nr:putative cathepsin B9 cysteine protease [Monocercomonoides exilis]
MAMIVFICLSLHTAFAWNLRKLALEINSRNGISWTAGINPRFEGMSEEEFRQINVAKHNPNSFTTPFEDENEDFQVPEEFDSRSQWSSCPTIGHIYDQGHCGSCWAMCSFEVLQDRFCIHSNGSEKPWLSGQDVTSCDKRSYGCGGGWSSTAFSYFQQKGIPTEQCVPYLMGTCKHPGCSTWPTPQCNRTCSGNASINYENDKYYAVSGYKIRADEKAIQQEIMRNGPVTAVFSTYDDLAVYRRGVYQHVAGKAQGLHAIKIVGWGVWRESEHPMTEEEKRREEEEKKESKEKREDKWHDAKQELKTDEKEKGVPYWTIVNSWGLDFGMDGILLIKRGSNECGIESDVYTGMPKLSKTVDRKIGKKEKTYY